MIQQEPSHDRQVKKFEKLVKRMKDEHAVKKHAAFERKVKRYILSNIQSLETYSKGRYSMVSSGAGGGLQVLPPSP